MQPNGYEVSGLVFVSGRAQLVVVVPLALAAALAEEERERAESRLASLEREKVDLEDTREGLLEMLHGRKAAQMCALQ